MATITLRLDPAQAQELIEAVNNLSTNIGKWQGQQTAVLEAGFKSLIALFGGEDPEQIQARIDEFTASLKSSTDQLSTAIQQQGE
jgi:ABC-type transporter Mla subunit MlaD